MSPRSAKSKKSRSKRGAKKQPPSSPLEALREEIVAMDRTPRLLEHSKAAAGTRAEWSAESYWAKPVPGYGDPAARLWVIGLAPRAHGANRTGTPFLGEMAGDWLFSLLKLSGFFRSLTWLRDGERPPELRDVWLSYAVRSAAPRNRPRAEEIDAHSDFLRREKDLLTNLKSVLVLGDTAFDAVLQLWPEAAEEADEVGFQHGRCLRAGAGGPLLCACLPPSRHYLRSGQLTRERFAAVFRQAVRGLNAP